MRWAWPRRLRSRRTGGSRFLLIAALLTAATPAGGAAAAQPAPDAAPLGLGEAVDRALAHYPSVGSMRAAAEAARAGHGEAKAAWWPEFGVTGSLTRHQEPMIVHPIHDFTPGQTPDFDRTLVQGGAYLRWVLFDGGGREAGIRRARWEEAAAEADLEAAGQSLIAEVAAAYLQALSGRRVLDAHDRRVTALEAELERVRRLREVGRAAEVDVLRAEAALASARSERVVVATDLEVALRELSRLIGAAAAEPERRGLTPLRLAGAAPPPREELVGRAVAASPSVEAARRRRSAAEAGRALARSRRWPGLEASGNWTDYAGLDSDHEVEWAAGVRLTLPLFTGGRIARGVDRAEAEARAADERLRLAVASAERAADRTLSLVEETEARLRSLATAVARSREVVRIEKLRLETGTGTQTDYLDAEAGLLALEAALVESRHASILARVELARALGELSPEWLAAKLEIER